MKTNNQIAIEWNRVSSEEQGKKYSLEGQHSEIINYASNNKINIIKRFISKSSGFHFDNPEFQQLLDYMQDNKDKVNLILFTENDRLMRDSEISGYLKYTCRNLNIKLLAINEDIKTDSNEAQDLSDTIMMAVKKYEVMRKNRRAKRGRITKFQIGGHISKAPYGYESVKQNGRCILKPSADAINVQNIFKDYLKEDKGKRIYGYMKLARKYNLFYDEAKTKPASLTIRNILFNPIYIGFVRMKNDKDVFIYKKSEHTPIIAEDIFFSIIQNNKIKELLI